VIKLQPFGLRDEGTAIAFQLSLGRDAAVFVFPWQDLNSNNLKGERTMSSKPDKKSYKEDTEDNNMNPDQQGQQRKPNQERGQQQQDPSKEKGGRGGEQRGGQDR
jgi:hypothetical protein